MPLFPLRRKGSRQYGPYCLWARAGCVLLGNPGIQCGQLIGLQAYANERALAGGNRATTLLCYHGLTSHRNRVITQASRGEASTSAPALTRAKKDCVAK
jgi:hypothetical protein